MWTDFFAKLHIGRFNFSLFYGKFRNDLEIVIINFIKLGDNYVIFF